VYYQVLAVKPDPDNRNRLKISASVRVPPTDTIYDPGDGKVKVLEYITGRSTGKDANGNQVVLNKLGEIFFYATNKGMIVINPKNKRDLLKYQYLEATNYNASNPNRDANVQPLFKRLDKKQDAKAAFEKELSANEAVQLALKMPYRDLELLATELKVDTNRDPYEVRMAMKVKAQANPALFIQKSSSGASAVIHKQIQQAQDKGVITYNEDERRWQWLPNRALILEVKPTLDPLDELVVHFTENDKGAGTFDKVLTKL